MLQLIISKLSLSPCSILRPRDQENYRPTKESNGAIDLTGGYYDSGDNVKFGFPMAFTVTLLSWSAVEFSSQLYAKGELQNALAAIRWGTDYLLKAHPQPDVLYAEVGDGNSDHACWQRPEDMTTPRNSYWLGDSKPGSDVAGETAAALAAASIVFGKSDGGYAGQLVSHAKQLFDFARNHRGVYSNSIPIVQGFYSSSGFDDELLWAAAWLHRATGDKTYLDFLGQATNTGGTRSEFSWDDKFAGVQVLVSKLVLENTVPNNGVWAQYKSSADQFICNVIQKGSSNTKKSPGGLLWFLQWNNLQYTTAASLLVAAHADHLAAARASLQCPAGAASSNDLLNSVRGQADYILGVNPLKMSYMVGFGPSYPTRVHHRAASIPSIKMEPTPIDCKGGFSKYFNANTPNPNILDGAVVGGPDANDGYTDSRSDYNQNEPATVTTAAFVGVLARLA
ncbi:uncharacterized protein A4U43_C07F4290 [Asparagus officinalis]|uniref:Endoglucanase n=1 Tax=Asparagus officinalis TaxID=4686 RepID=A0A5P1EBA1_ASPOF|nr:uncharacterized protein A4U43_C07F4290 [Asparagus officinalis]